VLEAPSLGLKQAQCEATTHPHIVPRSTVYILLLYMPACCTKKGEVQPVTVHEAPKGVYLYSFFNFGPRWEWVVNTMPWPLYSRKETQYPLYRRLDGPKHRISIGTENLSPTAV
jgi:hypothetical protein